MAGRIFHAGCCLADKIILMHGGLSANKAALSDMYALDTEKNKWDVISANNSPSARYVYINVFHTADMDT